MVTNQAYGNLPDVVFVCRALFPVRTGKGWWQSGQAGTGDWGLGAGSSHSIDKVDRVKRRYPMTSLHRAPHSPHSTYPKDKLERFACEKGAC